ncbi:MAG TPA: radical SAM protein [Candidatus Brocadiia bacterium]|nr:radical SAM protein [Candidatus Brocadiia bacterium]
MKILFVHEDFAVTYPQGMAYLSGALKEAGHETRLEFARHRDFLERVSKFRPDVLAYSVMTGVHTYYLDVNLRVKRELPELKAVSVFGGPHATFAPGLIEREGVDAVCVGEGENSFREFVDCLADGKDYTAVAGFHVRTKDGIVRNEPAPLVSDLDSLAQPDYNLFFDADPLAGRMIPKVFMPFRGCPFPCAFCFNHKARQLYAGKGRWIRAHSVEYILKAIEDVRERHAVPFVRFDSDNFLLFPEWLEEFAEKYPQRVGVPFEVHLRLDEVDEKKADLLVRAGCRKVEVGVEAGSDRVRMELMNRKMDKDTILRGCRILNDRGFALVCNNIIGSPSETFTEALETARLNADARPSYAAGYLYTPLPGTSMAEFAVEQRYFDGDFDKVGFAGFYGSSVLRYDDPMEKRRLENLQKLLGISVAFPVLIKALPFLTGLPLSPIYGFIHLLWWGLVVRFRVRSCPVQIRLLPQMIFRFFSRFGY